jgi:hypothetical protein
MTTTMGEFRTLWVDSDTVITKADRTVMLSPELWREIQQRPDVPGCWLREDVLAVGTVGKGLGVVLYTHVEQVSDRSRRFAFNDGHHIMQRLDPDDLQHWQEYDRHTGQVYVHSFTGAPCFCGGADLPHPPGTKGCGKRSTPSR